MFDKWNIFKDINRGIEVMYQTFSELEFKDFKWR